ncbi:MAG: citramalate synthase [Chloroflexi bacterium]|nr:citramalate synthase [Chloroflexota bacterium]
MSLPHPVYLYDTSLRDGAQMEGISYTAEEKVAIARRLDDLGLHFVEGGWPGSNPKDAEFFNRMKRDPLRHAVLTAFSMTRRPNSVTADDVNIRALLDAETPGVTFVGKSWDMHVTRVLNTTLDENRRMIGESIEFMRRQGRRVFFDAEHFFDGFKGNPAYALSCLRAAWEAGAETLVLCDTNGGTITTELLDAIRTVQRELPRAALGIHTHNDCDLAVASSIAALQIGVTQVQGTINGYGERCGNANLCSIIPLLQVKMGVDLVRPDQLARFSELSVFVGELANLRPEARQPFVGRSAFTHKAGLHVDALAKFPDSYQHMDPDLVGNAKRVVVSELSGRSNIVQKAAELGHNLAAGSPEVRRILEKVKELERRGFQYDVAEASYDLLVRRELGGYWAPFAVEDYRVTVSAHHGRPGQSGAEVEPVSEARVKLWVGDEQFLMLAEGDGPVHALDTALRKALSSKYPAVDDVRLVDYAVRIMEDDDQGTGAQVRVLIESTDGVTSWRTVGVSTNLIEASWQALADSVEYLLMRRGVVAAGR